jgi:multiple sugar transport system substrate-binding protein
MFKKKWMPLLLWIPLLLTGCKGKTSDSVTIFIYGQAHERSIYSKIIEKFTEETGIKVNAELVNTDGYAETLTASLGTKNAPDVFYSNPASIGRYAMNGVILDLKPYLEIEAEVEDGLDYKNFLDGVVDYYRYDVTTKKRGEGEAVWAIPKDVSSYPLGYNRNIINLSVELGHWATHTKKGAWASREGGMPLPWENDPRTDKQIVYTFEEFTNACRATKFIHNEIEYFGTALIDTWAMHSWIWAAGGNWLSDDGKTVTVNTPEFIAGFTEFIDLMDNRGISQTREQMGVKPHYDRWMAGEVAFFNVGVWDVAAFESVPKELLDYGLMPTPRKDNASPEWYTYIGTLGYAVSSRTRVAQEAVKLALYMSMSTESYNRMTKYQTIQLPNNKLMVDEYLSDETIKPENKGIFLDVIQKGHGKLHPTAMAYNSLWYDAFIAELSRVWKVTDDDPSGEMSPAQYAAYVQPIMQAQLNIALADEAAGV